MTETATKSKWEWEARPIGIVQYLGGGWSNEVGFVEEPAEMDRIVKAHNAAVRELEAENQRLREALGATGLGLPSHVIEELRKPMSTAEEILAREKAQKEATS